MSLSICIIDSEFYPWFVFPPLYLCLLTSTYFLLSVWFNHTQVFFPLRKAKQSQAKQSQAEPNKVNKTTAKKSNQIKKRKNSINRLEFSAITAPFKSVIRHLLPAPPQGKWTSANPAKHEIQRYPQVNIWIGLEKTLRFYISRYLILQTNFFSFFFLLQTRFSFSFDKVVLELHSRVSFSLHLLLVECLHYVFAMTYLMWWWFK